MSIVPEPAERSGGAPRARGRPAPAPIAWAGRWRGQGLTEATALRWLTPDFANPLPVSQALMGGGTV